MIQERNREILERHRSGESFSALARDYGVSTTRVRQIFERAQKKEQRRNELVEADRRLDQPNLLHLEPPVRRFLAEFCGKEEFTPHDVEERGFWRANLGCENVTWRAIVKWMASAGKAPTKALGQWTIGEWDRYYSARGSTASEPLHISGTPDGIADDCGKIDKSE